MRITNKKRFIVFSSLIALIAISLFGALGYFFWNLNQNSFTLEKDLKNYAKSGEEVVKDLKTLPAMQIAKQTDKYVLTDNTSDGISITYNKEGENQLSENKETEKPKFQIDFPTDYQKPIEVKLDNERTITITDNSKDKATPKLLSTQETTVKEKNQTNDLLALTKEQPKSYLSYETNRKKIIYAYQKDQASGEKKLKNWIVYTNGTGQEQESYTLQNAKIKKNDQGQIEVFYFGEKELASQQAANEVEPSLLERAQKTLQQEMGQDILNSGSPDFLIPKPYFLDKDGTKTELDWSLNVETNTITLEIKIKNPRLYPIALDPTLSFTAPGQSNSGSVMTGEAGSWFGNSMTAGDFNADGKIDLAVGGSNCPPGGRVYIFYNGSIKNENALGADVVITGETANNLFGASMTAGDFNADGKTDLAVGAQSYSSNAGRAYIFYNGFITTKNASAANVIITGESDSAFGSLMTAGDFNADGKIDLAVGSYQYSSDDGRAYIFYNGSMTTKNASAADVIITGESNSYFGNSMTAGDFNADGKTDLAVGAWSYSSDAGRAYIFYNGSIITENASGADIIITGEGSYFGMHMTAGDFNADGKTDIAVGARFYSSGAGRVYIFYNGSIITENATGADVIITGEALSYFGTSMTAGDFNADGKTDLAVGANFSFLSVEAGRAYIFYNDSITTKNASAANVIITGEASSKFGSFVTAGDFNSDGKTDLAVGAPGYSSYAGRAYIFYSQNGQVNTNFKITGATSSQLGYSMTASDFNADGKTDLAVGAWNYSSHSGRAYIFYNDGSIPTTAATADVIITGGSYFGSSIISGDFNADGKTDLAVGAYSLSLNYSECRAYIFYNDGPFPASVTTADVIITSENPNTEDSASQFSYSMTAGDFNADGKTDLAIGAEQHSVTFDTYEGRAYIFYNGSIITENASGADVIITGETYSNFGSSMTAGDFNADGKIDLAVGAAGYSSGAGRAYIFYNGSITTKNASAADVIITGEASNSLTGYSMTSGDFNADGKTDLAVGACRYSSFAGRAYIFYNGSIITENVTGADVIITGEAGSWFSASMTVGDFNADSKNDLSVGAYNYSSSAGRAYIFYNGSIITENATGADVIITGEASSMLGNSMTAGDFNADGKTDLAVGAKWYSSQTGQVYIYETRDNYAWQLQPQKTIRTSPIYGQEMTITGKTGSQFGSSMTAGDFNADGKTDLAVGNYDRVYVFYNDGSVPSASYSGADAIILGQTTSSFACSMTAGDFNADGKTDLAVGDNFYSSSTGRVYIFYNGSIVNKNATAADVILTGESSNNLFGYSMTVGDFNADGEIDLAVGTAAGAVIINTGHVYIFYNGSITTKNASAADVIITDEGSNDFGISMTAGDFNADGKTDLAAGAWQYSDAGRAYIFYNGSIITENASGADVIITGEAASDFGTSMIAGDFNADGKTDLAVGAPAYSVGSYTQEGRAYVFYNDSSIPTAAANADVIITGENSGYFSRSMTAGDFNADGKTDLAMGAYYYPTYASNTGRAYIFYNGSLITENVTGADLIITGEKNPSLLGSSMIAGDFNSDGKTDLAVGAPYYCVGSSTYEGRVYLYTFNDPVATGEEASFLGYSMTAGDFNADGKTDLAVGAYNYGGNWDGRAYIFYNAGSITTTVTTADVIITGEDSSQFGYSMTAGDFNADGKTDLAVGAYRYSSYAGRAYVFYNGSIITENASGADVIITGEASSEFSHSMTSGDFNADGKTDLAVGAIKYSSYTGRAYIFYNGSITTESASGADVIITGEASSRFGTSMTAGDFNTDSKIDLTVGAYTYSSTTGRAYIFYNGSIITENASGADVIITGEASSYFGYSMTAGDFNADGKTDLAVGAYSYFSIGRAYIFYNGSIITENANGADVFITGEASPNGFGYSMTAGDFNADGKTDLAVGAPGIPPGSGRAYIFYNGTRNRNASTADIIYNGESSSGSGNSMTTGDFNADGKIDLVVGATGYSSGAGKFYVYTTESKTGDQIVGKMHGIIKTRGVIKMK